MFFRRWTEEEVSALRKAYELASYQYNLTRWQAELWGHWYELWDGPDRSLLGIRNKARQLGLEPKVEPRDSKCLYCDNPRQRKTKTRACKACYLRLYTKGRR